MNAKLAILLTVFLIAGAIYFGSPLSSPPVGSTLTQVEPKFDGVLSDPQASAATQSAFARLATYSQQPKVLSGQNVGHMSADLAQHHYRTWIRLTKFRRQQAPAIMAFDLGLSDLSQTSVNLRQLASEHAENGGIVSVSMHPSNPWTGGAYNQRKAGSFKELMQPGTEANLKLLETLDQAAEVLKELQSQQIPVLWRPLHEANGDWFWWSTGGDAPLLQPNEFKQLWKFMHDRLTQRHRLHNLIWVYAANAQTAPEVRAWKQNYPGDHLVDVAGIDYYGPDMSKIEPSYREAAATGKIVALAEFGKKPMDGSLDGEKFVKNLKRFPRLAYFTFWHSWPDNLAALADMDDVEKILNNDVVENLVDFKAGTKD